MEPSDSENIIREEYLTWKAAVPELYEMMLEHTLTWPSLTCQWLPTFLKNDDKTYYMQELLIGTNTNDEEPNYVQILQMSLPFKDIYAQTSLAKKPKWEVVQKIRHEGEVNRARYQPFNPDIIATKTRDGPVLVFDRMAASESECTPILRLEGHSQEGYGLEWSPLESTANHVLSAGFDHLICQWDIGSEGVQSGHTLKPYQCYKGHTGPVGDISWHATNNKVFASVADDKKLLIWDSRTPEKPTNSVKAHRAEINTVAFNMARDYLLATGSNDKTIGLFDIRKLPRKLHSFEFHQGPVSQVAWSPFDEAILASAGADRRINVWDLKRIGEEQTPADMMDGPPELLFMHSGHTNTITEFSWNPTEHWVIASTAEDNIMQFWEMAKSIYANKSLQLGQDDLE